MLCYPPAAATTTVKDPADVLMLTAGAASLLDQNDDDDSADSKTVNHSNKMKDRDTKTQSSKKIQSNAKKYGNDVSVAGGDDDAKDSSSSATPMSDNNKHSKQMGRAPSLETIDSLVVSDDGSWNDGSGVSSHHPINSAEDLSRISDEISKALQLLDAKHG